MSTRSRIAVVQPSGRVKHIYCHSDGYPEFNGCLLRKHYSDTEKANELIALGDISQLAPNLYPTGPHSFDNPQAKVVVAFGRDRKEKDCEPSLSLSLEWLLEEGDLEEFLYVWNGKEWLAYDTREEPKLVNIPKTSQFEGHYF